MGTEGPREHQRLQPHPQNWDMGVRAEVQKQLMDRGTHPGVQHSAGKGADVGSRGGVGTGDPEAHPGTRNVVTPLCQHWTGAPLWR